SDLAGGVPPSGDAVANESWRGGNMVNLKNATPEDKADAKSRSLRTFFQNILIDVVLILGPVLYSVTDAGIEAWTSPMYWQAVGLTVGKTLVQIVLAYAMRLAK